MDRVMESLINAAKFSLEDPNNDGILEPGLLQDLKKNLVDNFGGIIHGIRDN